VTNLKLLGLRRLPCAGALAALAVLAGCSSTFPLMPTPMLYAGKAGRPLFAKAPPAQHTLDLDLLYVTDRAPRTDPDDPLPYTAERSRALAFGAASVKFGEGLTWEQLVRQSTAAERPAPLDLELGPVQELGRFPDIPYAVESTGAGITRNRATVDAHERAAAELRAEIERRLAASPRKEVVLFVHGYANTFRDAALTMGELCHYLGREFVCAVFSWPAGGSRGLFFGYNVDRESSEYAVLDLKKTIRIIADTAGVEGIHLLAHSRGTDVLAGALSQLAIESYVGGAHPGVRFKIRNIVLMAPDIDADVAMTKVFVVPSDPDLPFGKAPAPYGVFPAAGFGLTVYVSPDDRALSVAQYLFGSLRRLGRIDLAQIRPDEIARLRNMGLVDVVQVSGKTDPFGHSYFTSNPEVSADLIALIRFGLKPNEPGRPLIEVERPLWRVPPVK
jgi:esterase/lipase superfamily enzyme